MVGLGFLPNGEASYAYGVSADGSTVVGGTGNQAFRWTAEGGMVGLGYAPGDGFSSAYGVSADGSVVVGTGLSATVGNPEVQAIRWTAETGVVGILGGHGSGTNPQALAVSADGSVVVGTSYNNLVNQAFRLTLGGVVNHLGTLQAPYNGLSQANGVSAEGSAIVGYSQSAVDGTVQAFRWTEGEGMVGLGFLPNTVNTIAYGVSANGSVIVGIGSDIDGVENRAMIWDPTFGVRSLQDVLVNANGLDLDGWTLAAAKAISADGRTIVGYGLNPDGFEEAWIARDVALIPEPGTGLLVTAGVLGLSASRRRNAN